MGTRYHYRADDIISALEALNIQQGDTVFVHSNVGFLGRLDGATTPDDYYPIFKNAFFTVLGDTGTLVMPTFSYSFCRQQPFNIQETPGTCGVLSEHMRCDPDAKRYGDANFSVVAIGAQAEAFTQDAPTHSFGAGSFWERFLQAGGKFCNINFDAGSTFIHYVEKQLAVPYRYDKPFSGHYINEQGITSEKTFIHFVSDLEKPQDRAEFTLFDRQARRAGLVKSTNLGKGQLVSISATDTFFLIEQALKQAPRFLTARQTTVYT